MQPGEFQGRGSLVGCRLWGRTESDTTDVPGAPTAAAGQGQRGTFNLMLDFRPDSSFQPHAMLFLGKSE